MNTYPKQLGYIPVPDSAKIIEQETGECVARCCTGKDTEFVDFSNKNVAKCAQCGELWYFEAMREDAKS